MAYGGGWTGDGMLAYFEPLVRISMLALAEVVRSWPRLGEDVAQRLVRAAATAPKRAVDVTRNKKGDFLVLCHGDAWSNNIMFAYDEDTAQVRSAMLVDFQMVTWGSPALDLHYFISLAVSPRVRRESAARVVRSYHNELVACLAALGWHGETPSLAALQRDMRARAFWAFVSTVILLPVRFVETGLAMDSQSLLDKDNPARIRTLHDPLCRGVLEEAIPEFANMGFLD